MAVFVKIHLIHSHADAPSTIWTCHSIVKIVPAASANAVSVNFPFQTWILMISQRFWGIFNSLARYILFLFIYLKVIFMGKKFKIRNQNHLSSSVRNFIHIRRDWIIRWKFEISVVDECQTGQNDCSPEATCTDTEDSYVCACPDKYIDVSPDTVRKPGRRCLLSKFFARFAHWLTIWRQLFCILLMIDFSSLLSSVCSALFSQCLWKVVYAWIVVCVFWGARILKSRPCVFGNIR